MRQATRLNETLKKLHKIDKAKERLQESLDKYIQLDIEIGKRIETINNLLESAADAQWQAEVELGFLENAFKDYETEKKSSTSEEDNE